MTQGEIETIKNVIAKLNGGRNGHKCLSSDEITAMLNNPRMANWLDTWVIGALECLLPGPGRNVELGRKLSR